MPTTYPITLHYHVRKHDRSSNTSETGAILAATSNPLGWGVSSCDGIDLLMARRYLRDTCDELTAALHSQASGDELKRLGAFDAFRVASRRGYWRVTVTIPDEAYKHRQLIADHQQPQSKP